MLRRLAEHREAIQQKAHRARLACGSQSFETSQASGGLAFSWELMINQLCEGGIDAAWGRGAQKSIARNLFPLLSLSPLPSRRPTHPKLGLRVQPIPSPASLPFRPPGLIGEHIYVFTRMSPNNETTNSSQCRESNPSQSNPSDPRLSPQD